VTEIEAVADRIAPFVIRTPTVGSTAPVISSLDVELFIKLELLQRTGSFKPRGAVNTLLQLEDAGRGITAFSAGNHAIAAAYAAQALGVPAKVVMPKTASKFRVERCRALGAEIVFGDDIAALLKIVERLQHEEGLALVHPFEGQHTVAGTATVGLELCSDVSDLNAVIVPVGGGGLIAGIASAVKQLQPNCRVIGVEPVGAQGMASSLAAGRALPSVAVDTIADSLGAPLHLPLTFSLIQAHVDEMVQVSDDQLRESMRLLFTDMKLAVEPACAAGPAALLHPLQGKLTGQRVALIACGSNIDIQTWQGLLA
jgi:threonine dehydratase